MSERREPIFNAPPATVHLCGLLVLVFVAMRLAPQGLESRVLSLLAFVPANFALIGELPLDLTAWQIATLATHTLLHADIAHILVNAGFLLAFGSVVERSFGLSRFILLYLVSAACGALVQAWMIGPEPVPMIGASAAVYAMMGAAVRQMFADRSDSRSRMGLQFIAVIMGLNLLLGLVSGSGFLFDERIAWQAHVGGFVVGLLFALVLPPSGGRAARIG